MRPNARNVLDAKTYKRAPALVHGRPLFAKPSRYDGKKVKIAAIALRAGPHPDFGEAYAFVPDGIR